MANELDLKSALGMFVQGARDYGLSKAISDAQSKVQEIKMAGLKDAEQRRALGELAQGLTGQLVGMGVNPMQVQQAAGSMNAPQYANVDQALFQGQLNGDTGAVEAAKTAQMTQRADEMAMLQAKSNINEASQKRLFDHQEKRDAAKANMKPPTADQWKAAGFSKRLVDAEDVFTKLKDGGFNKADVSSSLGSKLPNALQSKENQQQSQAERNFVNAVLRRESGAAISPAEFESAKLQYFPSFGDSPEVLAQKEKNRSEVIQSLSAEATPALNKMGVSAPKATAPALPKGFTFVK